MRDFLRRAFTEHLGLKLLSLGLSVVLFLIVRADKDAQAVGYVGVEYDYNKIRYVMVTNPPKQLRISVRGPWSKVNRFDDRTLKPILLKVEPGKKHLVAFQPDMIRLPRGLRVVAISPPTAEVRIDRLLERKISVTPRIVGEPATGYMVKGKPKVEPATILLRGPKGVLDELERSGLALAPVDVTNAEGPVERQVEVVTSLPEHTKALTSTTVRVALDIVAAQGERAFPEVSVVTHGFKDASHTPVLDLSAVGVWLKGPVPVLDKLSSKDLSLVLDLSAESRKVLQYAGEVIREVGPGDVKGLPKGVVADKVVPPRIKVRFVRREPSPAPPMTPTPAP